MSSVQPSCRWCRASDLEVVLDLGRQPTADLFPPLDSPGPDPVWPLAMACCSRCGLVQLVSDPGVVEQPLGVEPRAMIEQALDAVARVQQSGLVAAGRSFAEFDSPHGGSWRALLRDAGAADRSPDPDGPAGADEPVDVVVDVFGLMHEADQSAALARRVDRLRPGGTLLLQYHSLESILRQRQWNALRHGHMAYYSTRWLTTALAEMGLRARRAWTFELYGGTVLLAADRAAGPPADPMLERLLVADDNLRLTHPVGSTPLAGAATAATADLLEWLAAHRDAGRTVLGYGAASRAVPLLVAAGVGPQLLAAVADGSPAKHGRALPGSRIPIISPGELVRTRPDVVLVFVPDLLDEVRRAIPEVDAYGGRWAVSEPQPRLV